MRYLGFLFVILTCFACSGRQGEEAAPKPQESLALVAEWAAGTARADGVEDGWLQQFQDVQLAKLVDEALAHNSELRQVAARLDEVRARSRQAGADLLPTLSAAFGGSRADNGRGPSEQLTAGLTLEWELDVWGRLRSANAAADLDVVAAEADLQGARQTLAGNVATAWFLAITSQQLVALSEATVATYKQNLQVVSARKKQGVVGPMDLQLATSQLRTAEAKLVEDRGALANATRSLELLLGRYPKAELSVADTLPPLPAPTPTGLPSDLLERRPDIVAADRRVAAAFQRSESARAARLPRFAITATGGVGGPDLATALDPANAIWNLGTNLLAPIIDGGRGKAQVDVSDAQQEQALAQYVSIALNAFKEVEDALAAEQVVRERIGFLRESVNELQSAANIARKQNKAGLIDALRLNDVERQLFSAQSQLVALHGTQLQQRVLLHLALGGDFKTKIKE